MIKATRKLSDDNWVPTEETYEEYLVRFRTAQDKLKPLAKLDSCEPMKRDQWERLMNNKKFALLF
jgi:hypothetical protein